MDDGLFRCGLPAPGSPGLRPVRRSLLRLFLYPAPSSGGVGSGCPFSRSAGIWKRPSPDGRRPFPLRSAGSGVSGTPAGPPEFAAAVSLSRPLVRRGRLRVSVQPVRRYMEKAVAGWTTAFSAAVCRLRGLRDSGRSAGVCCGCFFIPPPRPEGVGSGRPFSRSAGYPAAVRAIPASACAMRRAPERSAGGRNRRPPSPTGSGCTAALRPGAPAEARCSCSLRARRRS